jgi:ABC-type glycerol-3-phosphate transport system substrate-binding protein
MKFKKIMALVTSLMVLTTVTGYGAVTTKKAASPVTITWSFGKDVTPTSKAIADAFNKKICWQN